MFSLPHPFTLGSVEIRTIGTGLVGVLSVEIEVEVIEGMGVSLKVMLPQVLVLPLPLRMVVL